MEETNSSSRLIPTNIFEKLIDWRRERIKKNKDLHEFNWSPFHLEVVRGYVLKLNLNYSRLLNQARLVNNKPVGYEIEKVESFMDELEEAFVVPKQHQLFKGGGAVEKHGLVAAFIDMLLHVLQNRPDSFSSLRTRIDPLEKELRFLLAVLGDKSFIFYQHQQVANLLIEFEAAANEAGSVVHFIYFKTKSHNTLKGIGNRYGKFFKHVNHLKDELIKFMDKLQQGIPDPEAYTSRKTAAADSLVIMDSLLGDLGDLLKREDAVIADAKDHLKSLQQELSRLHSFIKICQHSEIEELHDNVMPIRELAYEAEYLTNYFLDGYAPAPPHKYFYIRLSHVISKIKSIEQGIQAAKKKNCDDIGVSKFTQMSLRTKRNIDVENVIVGFEDKAEEILPRLLYGETCLQIVSIHGMPGVGKTTLATKLYNHPSVKDSFNQRLLIVVSQKYDRRSLLIDIVVGLEAAANMDKDEILNANEKILEDIIRKHILTARYFIVLDDIWTLEAWYDLQSCFPDEPNRSRILFTSRSNDVAPPKSITYELLPTTDEHCWEILREKWFQKEPYPPHLIMIGKEIAKSCHGLPLVVLLVVGILSTKGNEESRWKEVKENLAYVFSDVQNNSITQLLEMSYNNLQDHLKPCFLYFGAFPRARRIRVPELLRLWIAEGFVCTEEGKSPETTAKEYLMELISKSLVTILERRSNGGVKTCVIHDLLHEFCLQKCEEEILHTVVNKTPLAYKAKKMEETNSSSRLIPTNIFEKLIDWRRERIKKNKDLHEFNWSPFHLEVVRGYVLKLNLNSYSRLLNQARLVNNKPVGYEIEKVESFMDELEEAFVVPKQHQLFKGGGAVEKHGLVAAFIDMLLRVLQNRPDSFSSLRTRIDPLEKELRFLLAVLGDKSFIFYQHQQVANLLIEFEAAANEAGRVVHFIYFKTKSHNTLKGIGNRYGKFFKHVNHLKDELIKFMDKLQQGIPGPEAYTSRKTAAADSLVIMDSLLGDLGDLLKREDAVIADAKDHLKSLQQELSRLHSFIKICQHSEIEELHDNVMPIRELAYEAEYLTNYFLDGYAPAPPHKYFYLRLSHVISKIKSIEPGIQAAKKKNCDDIGVSKFTQMSLQTKRIIGFEDKAEEILPRLLYGETCLQIVSIHGMPGVGKTTLATKLYNHPSVKDWFDQRLFIVVSQKYDRRSLLIDIVVGLEAATNMDKDEILNASENILENIVRKHIGTARYFIILDDIWTLEAWYDLQSCFPDMTKRSRILFTSRSNDVAPPKSITYELLPTTDEHCWKILEEKVFQKEPCPQHLLKIGKEIAKSCHGLPLVVLLVVGILLTKGNEESAWKEVKGNLASYVFSDVQNNSITQLLEMSYNNLQDHLKPCFLYFGAFPRARRIRVPELLRLWIAEGFVCTEEGKSPETTAKEYLMELISKSLVTSLERRSNGGVKTCVIHDLLHEFCLQKCEEEILHTVVDKRYFMNATQQRLRIQYFKKSPRFPMIGLHVRSIFGCFPTSGFLNMRLLKILDLMGVISHESLKEIKVLINLRHLAIGYGLPSTQPQALELALISCLVKLEYLLVKSQYYLVCTPSELARMIKLRHVQVYSSVQFGEECSSSEDYNNLEFLSNVKIRNAKDEQMLRCSPHLRRLRCECTPFLEGKKREYRYPDFSFFTQLESLHIHDVGTNTNLVMSVISLPSSIIELILYDLSIPWEKMSIIGRLQNLQDLKLIGSGFVGETWVTEDDQFQQLQFLTLQSVLSIREWRVKNRDHFKKLRGLILDGCLNLGELPHEIGDIPTLEFIQIKGACQATLKETAEDIEQEQDDNGNEELKFDLHNIVIETEDPTSTGFSLFYASPLDS